MPRLFVAVDLDSELRAAIATMCTGVHNARWVKPTQLHITLRFLGEVAVDAVPDVRGRLSGVKAPAFHLSLHGVGVFPEAGGRQRPRVLWLGIEPTDPLVYLKRAIDRALPQGHSLDAKATKQDFSPHLTLARFSKPADQTLPSFVARYQGYRSATWHATCFKLYQSTLHSSGSIHTPLEAYQLALDASDG
jgi:2'-5' RNA ligase